MPEPTELERQQQAAEALKQQFATARAIVARLVEDGSPLRMSIPARPSDDDLVLTGILNALEDEIESLRADKLRAEALAAVAKRERDSYFEIYAEIEDEHEVYGDLLEQIRILVKSVEK